MATNLKWIRREYYLEAVCDSYRLEVTPRTHPSKVCWEVIDRISDTVVAEGRINCGKINDPASRFKQYEVEIKLAKQQAELKCDELIFDNKFITW